MTIPKDQIVAFLKARGKDEWADQAERSLPEQVDVEKYAPMLEKYGVDVKDLLGRLPGGLGEKLGGFFGV